MRTLISFILVSLWIVSAKAQPYGNEWINYSQKYWRFPVTEDGIYRINYASLVQAGYPVNSISAKNIQLFARGQEIPLFIEGEGDGIFNTNDFIEFYGQRNDGYFDSIFYKNPSQQVNPYFSLFGDTAYYYLTYNNQFSGNLRYSVQNDNNFSTYTPVNFYYKSVLRYFNNYYHGGPRVIFGLGEPGYMDGEGYVSSIFGVGSSFNINLPAPQIYSGANATLKYGLITDATGKNTVQFVFNNTPLTDTSYTDFNHIKRKLIINNSLLNANNAIAVNSIAFPGVNSTGRIGLAYTELMYPHLCDFEDSAFFNFYLNEEFNEAKTRLDFTKFSGTATNSILYDLSGKFRISFFNNGSGFSALIPSIGAQHQCVIVSQAKIKTINNIKLANPTGSSPGFFTNYKTTLSGAEFLIVSHPSLSQAANNYATYRTSKGLNASYVNINELYEQYAHGINKNPYAIRGLIANLLKNGTRARYLLLLGKGISSSNNRFNSTNYNSCLVPTWGEPASDNLITANINTPELVPSLATGRVAAKNNAEAQDYLNKIIEFENNAPALWMKNILHFAGGTDINQNNELKSYLQLYADTLEDFYFGGKIHLFSKTTNQPIQTNVPDSVKNLINNGVSLMTFFGHAAGSSFDVSIDYASNYNNQGKYPLIVANSCYAGDIHTPSSATTSEDWVLNKNKGAIGFLAQVGTGVTSFLNIYSTNLFNNIGKINYGKSIGTSIQNAINTSSSVQNNIMRATCLEMTLHGDPAIILNSPAKPDFLVTANNIITSPQNIDATVDSFTVKAVINNIGRAYNQPVQIEYKRTLPNQITEVYATQINRSYYADTAYFKFPTKSFEAGGINNFCVNADPSNAIDELENYINNKACYGVNINSDDVFPIYPYNYSVIPNDTTRLIASTSNPLAPLRNYKFQIDTTDLFNSPFLKQTTVNKPGGIVQWNLPFLLTDSTVYFWRVAYDDGSTNLKWKEFSFQYIPAKSGWGQSHFFQFKENEFTFLNYNRNIRKLEYVNSSVNIQCDVIGNSVSFATGYKIDGNIMDYAGCGFTPQINIAVIDTLTFKPWLTDRNNYGNNNAFINGQSACGSRINPDASFAFAPSNPSQLQAMRMFLDTAIPNGYYILMYTYVHGDFSKWDNTTISFLNSLGGNVNNFMGSVPYIFFCKKGDVNSAEQVIGTSINEVINYNKVVSKNWNYGNMNSVIAGPANKWNSFHWRTRSIEVPSNDEVIAKIYGLKNLSEKGTLLAQFNPSTLDVLDLYNYADANVYPYLKLNFYTKDDITLNPRQLRYWRLLHDEVPEATVAPNIKMELSNSNVNSGEDIKLTLAVKNISDVNMDSLMINYWIINNNNQRIDLPYNLQQPLPYKRQSPLFKEDTMYSTITIPTLSLSGSNSIWMEINPNNDQPEKYHFNNFFNLSFGVNPDKINPLLDVTFDGIRIMNGDIVSAKPDVLITLKDENKFLAINDTSLFNLYLIEPDNANRIPLYFAETSYYKLEFTPASLPSNRAKINYKPSFTKDGVYQLVVQGKDVSGNRSGSNEYKISFEIVTKSTITEVLNYPNPFSTSTRFVFTLTGSEIPTYFKIQILSISGKVVREIDLSELGSIHIGRNITEYAWDGTDSFGDKLANGVYFYKVVTNINGQTIEKRETKADTFFKKGFGKLYIMR